MSLSEFWRLLEAAALGWWNDGAMSLGAAIAFFTVFSLAPMLLAVIAIASPLALRRLKVPLWGSSAA